MSDTEKTGNVVKNTTFKSAGDWINELLAKHCVTVTGKVEAVEAVEEIKDEDTGEIIQEAVAAVRGKKGKEVADVEALKTFADENNITYKEYPNPGMYRMNIGNMLRAAAKKRGGLNVPNDDGNFVWTNAPEGFEVNEKITQNPDGSKIQAPKAEPADEPEAEEVE